MPELNWFLQIFRTNEILQKKYFFREHKKDCGALRPVPVPTVTGRASKFPVTADVSPQGKIPLYLKSMLKMNHLG